jgi:CRP/FNR family cyclic AMP-dependent transcriptional regulator
MEWQLLAGLSADEVEEVLAAARRRSFRRNEVVFHEGDPGYSTHLVARGHFGLRVTSPRGQECTLRVYAPGEMFGRIGLPPVEAVRAATMVAVEGGETYEVGRELMEQLRVEHPSVNDVLLGLVGQGLYWVSQRYLDVLFLDADTRVRRRLLELGRQYGPAGSEGAVVIFVTQEDIAGLAGSSRATVNRVLGEEERHGALERRRGRILLLDPRGLEERAYRPRTPVAHPALDHKKAMPKRLSKIDGPSVVAASDTRQFAP